MPAHTRGNACWLAWRVASHRDAMTEKLLSYNNMSV